MLVNELRKLITPAVVAAGYECVDVEYRREQNGWVCRVFIDKTGGVTHDDCAPISRELSALLDVHDVISSGYQLEVSSPGVNRPLRTLAHFRDRIGQTARAKLRSGIGGRKNFRGTIMSVSDQDEKVVLEVDGAEYALPLQDLEKANIEYSFDRADGARDRGSALPGRDASTKVE